MAAPTLQDFFTAGKAEALTRRSELTFDEGDISEFYMFAAAAMADHLTGYAAGRFQALYLDGAQGADLTTLCDDHWGVQRQAANPATGVLTFSRATSTAGAGTIPAGTVVSTQPTAQGSVQQFTTDSLVTFGSSDLTKTVNATAVLAGVNGNVAASTITKIVGTLFDTTITVTNASRFAGGVDQETDEALRERTRQVPITLRRATNAALEYGAKTVAGVATAVADDTIGGALVNVYVCDASGNSSPTMVTNVTTELQNWRAAGIAVTVIGASLITQDVVMSISVRAGVTTASLTANIQAAVTARIAKLRIGETLTQAMIKQAVLNVDPNILDVTITTPAGSAVPLANQIIRAGSITVS